MSVTFRKPFDPEKHQQDSMYNMLPEGEYSLRCTDTEKKTAKSGNDMLIVHFEVVSGSRKGLTVMERLNLWNDSEVARDIAASSLASMCQAMGLGRIQDTADMHGKVVNVTVLHETKGEWTNMRFRGWRPMPPPDSAEGADGGDNDGLPF